MPRPYAFFTLLAAAMVILAVGVPPVAGDQHEGTDVDTHLDTDEMTTVEVARGLYEVVHPRSGDRIVRAGTRTVLAPTPEQTDGAGVASCSVVHTTFDPEVNFVPPGDYYAEGLLRIENGCAGSVAADHYLSLYESPGGWVVQDHHDPVVPPHSTRTSYVGQLCFSLSSESWLNSSSGGAGDQATLGCTA